MNDWQTRVRQWAHDRNLIEGSTPAHQLGKLLEECGELATAIANNDQDGIEDAIGDCSVVLEVMAACAGVEVPRDGAWVIEGELSSVIYSAARISATIESGRKRYLPTHIGATSCELEVLSLQYNTTLDACRERAWDEIKDRKGRMRNGVFEKEAEG